DHLDLDALPLLPALGADRLEDPVLHHGREADPVAGRRLPLPPAPPAGDGQVPSVNSRLYNGRLWTLPSAREASPTSTSRPKRWPAWTRWATGPPPRSRRRRCPGPSPARTWWCSPERAPARPPPSASPWWRGSTPWPTTCRRWRSLPRA